MAKINLWGLKRELSEKNSQIRQNKMIPAVIYWKTTKPLNIKMAYSEFLKTFRISGESQIITLIIEKKEYEVLVHDIQKEPVSWDYLHIDFYAITRWEKVHTKISLNFVWDAPAAKEWAIIDEHVKEIDVKVLPRNLVESFEVDLSKLVKIWDSIKLADLNIDESKFDILSSIDIIVSASEPAKIVIEEPIVEATTEETEETEEKSEEK